MVLPASSRHSIPIARSTSVTSELVERGASGGGGQAAAASPVPGMERAASAVAAQATATAAPEVQRTPMETARQNQGGNIGSGLRNTLSCRTLARVPENDRGR